MNININKLKRYLMDYYGTAMNNGFPMAVIELSKIENASPESLVEIAESLGIDLSKFAEEDFER